MMVDLVHPTGNHQFVRSLLQALEEADRSFHTALGFPASNSAAVCTPITAQRVPALQLRHFAIALAGSSRPRGGPPGGANPLVLLNKHETGWASVDQAYRSRPDGGERPATCARGRRRRLWVRGRLSRNASRREKNRPEMFLHDLPIAYWETVQKFSRRKKNACRNGNRPSSAPAIPRRSWRGQDGGGRAADIVVVPSLSFFTRRPRRSARRRNASWRSSDRLPANLMLRGAHPAGRRSCGCFLRVR